MDTIFYSNVPGPPLASVSVDLDNLWSYLKTQGVPGWERYPSYLELVVPRILGHFGKYGIKGTFFIVGRDAADPQHKAIMAQIADAGHEIANHSYEHEPWLHLYTPEQLDAELERTEQALVAATGMKPIGFRGPGFSSSPQLLQILRKRGYVYDSSVFPSFIGPLARTYFRLFSRLSPEEKAKRNGLYGPFRNLFAPLRPHILPDGLLELPVSTLPMLRAPLHFSYLVFLMKFSSVLARTYWSLAVKLYRFWGNAPTMLLHPTDFLDTADVPEMGFFPGMNVPSAKKLALLDRVLGDLTLRWPVVTTAAHARCALPHSEFHWPTPKLGSAPDQNLAQAL